MELKNKYSKPEENYKYHLKGDGVWMPEEFAFKCYNTLPRLRWAFDKIVDSKAKSLLDVGGKDMYLSLTMAKEGLKVVGIDPTREAVKEARTRKEKFEQATGVKLDAEFEDVMIEDYVTDQQFDIIALLDVLDRVIDPDIVMKKLKKLGKKVLISLPDYYQRFGFDDKKRNLDRVRIYKEDEIKKFLKKYGKIEDFIIADGEFLIEFTFN